MRELDCGLLTEVSEHTNTILIPIACKTMCGSWYNGKRGGLVYINHSTGDFTDDILYGILRGHKNRRAPSKRKFITQLGGFVLILYGVDEQTRTLNILSKRDCRIRVDQKYRRLDKIAFGRNGNFLGYR